MELRWGTSDLQRIYMSGRAWVRAQARKLQASWKLRTLTCACANASTPRAGCDRICFAIWLRDGPCSLQEAVALATCPCHQSIYTLCNLSRPSAAPPFMSVQACTKLPMQRMFLTYHYHAHLAHFPGPDAIKTTPDATTFSFQRKTK